MSDQIYEDTLSGRKVSFDQEALITPEIYEQIQKIP